MVQLRKAGQPLMGLHHSFQLRRPLMKGWRLQLLDPRDGLLDRLVDSQQERHVAFMRHNALFILRGRSRLGTRLHSDVASLALDVHQLRPRGAESVARIMLQTLFLCREVRRCNSEGYAIDRH